MLIRPLLANGSSFWWAETPSEVLPLLFVAGSEWYESLFFVWLGWAKEGSLRTTINHSAPIALGGRARTANHMDPLAAGSVRHDNDHINCAAELARGKRGHPADQLNPVCGCRKQEGEDGFSSSKGRLWETGRPCGWAHMGSPKRVPNRKVNWASSSFTEAWGKSFIKTALGYYKRTSQEERPRLWMNL